MAATASRAAIPCDPPELYNLDDDVGEQRDVAAQNAGVVETLKALTSEFQEAVQAGKLPKSHWRSLVPAMRRRKS